MSRNYRNLNLAINLKKLLMKLSWFWAMTSFRQFLKRKSQKGSYLQESGSLSAKLTISSNIWNPAKALSCTKHHYDLQKGHKSHSSYFLLTCVPWGSKKKHFCQPHKLGEPFLTWFLRLMVKESPEILILEIQISKPSPQDSDSVAWVDAIYIWKIWNLLQNIVIKLEIRGWFWHNNHFLEVSMVPLEVGINRGLYLHIFSANG